jgi:hypothetical protein
LYNFTNYSKLDRKFFSLVKIFWNIKKKSKLLSDYNLKLPVDFDFKKYKFKNDLDSFLNDILVTRIYFNSAYPTPYFYYHEIFSNK